MKRPLKQSRLEMIMAKAAIHGVAKSRIWRAGWREAVLLRENLGVELMELGDGHPVEQIPTLWPPRGPQVQPGLEEDCSMAF